MKQWISFDCINILHSRYFSGDVYKKICFRKINQNKAGGAKGAPMLPDRRPRREDNGEGTRGLSKVANITILTMVLALVIGGLLWWVDAYILHT